MARPQFPMLSQKGWSTRASELLFAVLMFALILPVLVIVQISVGQVTTSSVTGFVPDNSAAAVPEAAVTIKEVRTGFTRTATTNQLGQYSILAIPAGIYDFRVQKTGFDTIERTAQAITQQLAARVDFVLAIGALSQAVSVEGTAPLLQTETPSNAVTLTSMQITELPTFGHDSSADCHSLPRSHPGSSNSMLTVTVSNNFSGGTE